MKTLKLNIHYWILFLVIVLFSCKEATSPTVNRKEKFNTDWTFYLADSTNADMSKRHWRRLDLPHDWSIEGTFDEKNPATFSGGALPGGIGWYKKNFRLTPADKDKKIFIRFDGVYMDSEVWINDHYLGKRPNGYIGFEYDLTPYLSLDSENTIKVKVDNSQQPNSRWYSGSGIYRNVWLIKTDKLHVDTHGSYVYSTDVSDASATIHYETTVKNEYDHSKKAVLITKITDEKVVIAQTKESLLVDASQTKTFKNNLEVTTPILWSTDTPALYTLISELYIDDNLVDNYVTPFGIRNFKFDLEKGFFLNGQPLKIRGVCNHHDLGALGTAINKRALQRQIEILQGMGVNAIRTSHNPPAPELLDLCDEMGIIVMDEAFDMWKKAKTKFDYSANWEEWHQKDLEDFIKRDRNHPSVFIWSIGNEIPEQWSEEGIKIAEELSSIIRKLDSTRPITAGMNPPLNMDEVDVTLQFDSNKVYYNPLAQSDALDLIGYNYAHKTYAFHQKNFPNKPFIATETTSALATRGYYDEQSDSIKRWPVRWDLLFTDGNPGNTVSAYDQVSAPWGSTHEETWKVMKKHDFLGGMFIWTGFDYLGEPTPYVWPSRSSYFGVVDLAGFPKDSYYMYQSEWTAIPVLHVFPHWNWEKGRTVDVWAYYNQADEVELYLNGKSLGIRKKEGDDLHVMWRVSFEPGTLKAVSRKDGNEVMVKEIKTAGEPYQILMEADRVHLQATGEDLSFITVKVLDNDGIPVPTADNLIHFSLEGDGEIIAVDNGDPTSHESFKDTKRKAYNGKCLVVIKGGKTQGNILVKATSKGLKNAEQKLDLN